MSFIPIFLGPINVTFLVKFSLFVVYLDTYQGIFPIYDWLSPVGSSVLALLDFSVSS